MQRVHHGPLGPLVVVLCLWAIGCTTPSEPPTSSTPTTTTTTSIVTVTTAPPSTTDTTVGSQPAAAPTVVVPGRPPGLEILNLEDIDLEAEEVTVLNPSVVEVFPHDRTAVTESLAMLSETELIESTGFYGRSSRRVIDLTAGDLVQSTGLEPELYASGISTTGDGSGAVGLQFTQREQIVQRFNLTDLSLLSEERLSVEVYGACTISPSQTAVSTSSGEIHLLSSSTFEVIETLTPLLGDQPLPTLADLSCDNETIWAVLGATGGIAQLSIDTGKVVALADLSGLTPAGLAETDVLSGLTYRPSTETWFVTGKRWDVLYEITLDQ